MMNLTEIVQSSGWRNFMAKLYGWGASLVIIGALFKLMHWPAAGVMLTLGMSTEAIIFFFSAFEPQHEEVDWTLVYPELAGINEEEEEFTPKSRAERDSARTSSAGLGKLEEMLENAEITPELFEKLGEGLKNLNQTTRNLMNVSDAAQATNQFLDNLQAASESINSMTESYGQSSEQLTDSIGKLVESYSESADVLNDAGKNMAEQFAQSSQGFVDNYKSLEEKIQANIELVASGNQSYNEKLELLNKNLSALNSVYELQMQNTSSHVESSKTIFNEMDVLMNNIKDSVDETKAYKEEISKLNNNLTALNAIYGNMLSAMNVVK